MCLYQNVCTSNLVAFDFQSMEKILFVTNILQNIFFCVQRKKVVGLKPLEGGSMWHDLSFGVNYPFKYIWVAFYFINIKIPAITITLLKPFKNPAYRRRDT